MTFPNTTTEQDLRHIAFVASHEALKYDGGRSTCILTTAALIHCFESWRCDVFPLRLETVIRSDRYPNQAVVLGSFGDGSRQPAAAPGMWKGHLALVVNGTYLIDATIDQSQKAGSWIRIEPLVRKVSPEFLNGSEFLWCSLGNAEIRCKAYPHKGGFKHAADWRRCWWHPLAMNIKTRLWTEEWRPIQGFEGLYEISDLGRVRNVAERPRTYVGKILIPSNKPNRYPLVILVKGGEKRYGKHVHKLVSEAFIGPCPKSQEVDHLDGRKWNNAADNLGYCPQDVNKKRAAAKGLMLRGDLSSARRNPKTLARGDKNGARTHPEKLARGDNHWMKKHGAEFCGEDNPNVKLTDLQISEIKESLANGVRGATLARQYGVGKSTISRIKNGLRHPGVKHATITPSKGADQFEIV